MTYRIHAISRSRREARRRQWRRWRRNERGFDLTATRLGPFEQLHVLTLLYWTLGRVSREFYERRSALLETRLRGLS